MHWADPYEVPVTNKQYMDRMDYIISYFNTKQASLKKIRELKEKFSGSTTQQDIDYIQQTYVRNFRVQYFDYRLSYKVVMQMLGEWLRRPINSTVYVINGESMAGSEEAANIHIGLHYVENEVKHMRDNGYGDPFDGMTSSYDGQNTQSLLAKLNSKQSRVMIMQFILNYFIRRGQARDLLYYNYLDIILGASCFAKVYLGPSGKVNVRPVPNHRVVFVETEGDTYLDKSPFICEERPMTYGEILESWPELLSPGRAEDLEKLKSWFSAEQSSLADNFNESYYERVNDKNLIKVYSSQFYIYEPRAQKKFMHQDQEKVADFDPVYFVKNKTKILKNITFRNESIDVKYAKVVYGATKIGPDILVGLGTVNGQIRNPDDPSFASYDYASLLFNTVLGKRTSQQELMLQLDREYNLGRMMMNREMAKFNGNIIGYNRAFLPRGANGKPVSKEEIIMTAINDGFLDYNSAADGNYAGENIDPSNLLKNIDLGLSQSLGMIMQILYDIENTMLKIIGFNAERLGETPASSTVTNATNNLINSQASTAPIDYFFDRFSDKIFQKFIEKYKISLAFYQPREGNAILGPELMNIIKADPDFADDFYGIYTADSRREDSIRNRMSQRGEAASANGEIRTQDLAKAEMAETVQEAIAILDRSSAELTKIRQDQERMKNETAEKINQQQIMAMQQKDASDKEHDIGKTLVAGAMKKAEAAEKALQDYAMAVQQGENNINAVREKASLDNQ